MGRGMRTKRRISIKDQLYYSLGCQKLSNVFFKFMKSHVMFYIFTTLPGVFINTFFMNLTDDINVVLLYNAINYVFAPVGMQFAAIVLRKFSVSACSVTGVVLYNIYYILLLILQERVLDYYILLAALIGLAGGFYWMSYGILFSSYSNNENRDRATSLMNIATSMVAMLVPLISGAIISLFGGMWGYISVFALALLIALMTALVIIRLPVQRMEQKKSNLGQCYKMVFKSKTWLTGMSIMMGLNIREGAYMFIMNVLIYQFVNSEALVGLNSFLGACAGITASFLFGKMIHKNNRIKAMLVAISVIVTGAVFYLFTMNVYTAILFSVLCSSFTVFHTASVTNTNLSLFELMPGARGQWPELMAVRDIFVGTGRLISVLVIVLSNLLTGGSMFWQGVVLVALTAFQYLTVMLSKKCLKNLEKIQNTQEVG